MADDDAIVTLYGGMSRDEMLTNLLWWRSQAERNVQPPLTVAALQSRIAELEGRLARRWLPIETCPMCQYVFLWCDGFCVIGYQFKRGKFTEHHERERHEIFHVTRWMALPDGPSD